VKFILRFGSKSNPPGLIGVTAADGPDTMLLPTPGENARIIRMKL
jgi:hypothetical protein